MENAETILVVILAATLALVLVLGIVALIKVIQILNHLKHISEKAEEIADKAEAVGDFFSKAAGPLAIGRLFASVADAVMHRDKPSKKKSRKQENK